VWICPYPNGHIQAIGTDAAGRRQYRYHDEWRRKRDTVKHERVIAFAEALPAARRQVAEDLALPGMPKERVMACAVRLLDQGFFRIGSEEYAAEHETFGLATVRRDHVTFDGPVIWFRYPAKGGLDRRQLNDDAVRDVVATLKRRRGGGAELLAYRGGWHDVKSADINLYLRAITGGDFTAKDFRTWNATVMVAAFLAAARPAADSPTSSKRAVAAAVREVSRYLGNTPAVCRRSYIDPRVVEFYGGSSRRVCTGARGLAGADGSARRRPDCRRLAGGGYRWAGRAPTYRIGGCGTGRVRPGRRDRPRRPGRCDRRGECPCRSGRYRLGSVEAVNLLGTAAVIRAALPALVAAHGTVVIVASTLGIKAVSDVTAYCASKFSVVGFTRALAAELRGQVEVTLPIPGGTHTAFFEPG
jgi:DNA topoisomerase IB